MDQQNAIERVGQGQGEFLVHPQQALAQLHALQAVVKEVMREGEHYGTIPGTNKPTLYKPGAELLNNMYGFRLGAIEIEKIEQWDIQPSNEHFPLFRYLLTTTLVDAAGVVIATGIGECSSYESKYRYRTMARKCPNCGKETIIKGKEEYGGGWLCFAKKGGCGAKFPADAPEIIKQSEGRTFNENIFDQVNTIVKMAKKRSYVDATLSATRTSGMFTQDMEDFAGISSIPAQTVEAEIISETKHSPEQFQKDQGGDVPEVFQKSKQVQVGGVTFNEFNPETEEMPQGKYKGLHWIEVPNDYLEWLGGKGSPDIRAKCKATLEYKKRTLEQQSDPLDDVLGKRVKQ
jgi:uncharacterized protein (DUF3820 family)